MTLLWLAPAFGQTTAYGRRGLPMAYRIWRASGGLEPTEPCIRCFLIQVGFFLGAESKTGVVEGGVLPYQPWAAAKVRQLTQRMEFDPTGHCHYGGIPHAMYFSFQILETPQLIAVLHENMHAWRLISMDGSHHATDYSAWMGDSRGHWEGNTLVVDVADNNDKSVFTRPAISIDALHVVERFTPVDRDTINYQARSTIPKYSHGGGTWGFR
jgi:hypothetical protein